MSKIFDFSGVFESILVKVTSPLIIGGFLWLLGPLKWPIQNRRLRKLLNNRDFKFVYNPDPTAKYSKRVSFQENGEIGKGRNQNENHWRIKRGKLEIFNNEGMLYSRFVYDRRRGRLFHTNDENCRSILGQYFIPLN